MRSVQPSAHFHLQHLTDVILGEFDELEVKPMQNGNDIFFFVIINVECNQSEFGMRVAR